MNNQYDFSSFSICLELEQYLIAKTSQTFTISWQISYGSLTETIWSMKNFSCSRCQQRHNIFSSLINVEQVSTQENFAVLRRLPSAQLKCFELIIAWQRTAFSMDNNSYIEATYAKAFIGLMCLVCDETMVEASSKWIIESRIFDINSGSSISSHARWQRHSYRAWRRAFIICRFFLLFMNSIDVWNRKFPSIFTKFNLLSAIVFAE